MQLKAGEILGIVGKSGSGKTTLLKCIYGLEDLNAGEIVLDGKVILGPAYHLIPGDEDLKLVSQDFYVLDNHTVEENIFDKLIGYTTGAKQRRVQHLLRLLELQPLRHTRARYLSSGQKQRVAIARALAIIPKVLLLDEPFSNLDKLLTEKLFAFVREEVRKKNTAVLLITHLPEEALKYTDSLAILHEGRILQQGEKWKVYYRPKNIRLAGLLGDYNLLHPDDLTANARPTQGTKQLVRPNQLQVVGASEVHHLKAQLVHCAFNGKCYELLAETRSGKLLVIYHAFGLENGSTLYLRIERSDF